MFPNYTSLYKDDLAPSVAQICMQMIWQQPLFRKELAMNWLNYHNYPEAKEDIEKLRKAGLNSQEIAQLCQLRRNYRPDAQDRVPVDHTRLNFVRWLVSHGKLSEQ